VITTVFNVVQLAVVWEYFGCTIYLRLVLRYICLPSLLRFVEARYDLYNICSHVIDNKDKAVFWLSSSLPLAVPLLVYAYEQRKHNRCQT
jgi:hypothetical protein